MWSDNDIVLKFETAMLNNQTYQISLAGVQIMTGECVVLRAAWAGRPQGSDRRYLMETYQGMLCAVRCQSGQRLFR